MLPALLAVLCVATGLLLVLLLWPRESAVKADWLLQGSLSLGCGLGLFSIILMLCRATGGQHLLAIDLVVFALLLAGYLYRNRLPAVITTVSLCGQKPDPHRRPVVLRAAFAIGLLAALYSAILRSVAHPHGDGWDAFAIWNLHARFLFRGGTHWRDGFNSLIPWSHPDYPLLLPAAIAHFWTVLGQDAQMVPVLIGLVFTFSTVALLYSSLAMLRGPISAMLAGLTLLATPFFIEQGTAQYADVPLSFFILATIVLICIHENSAEVRRRIGLPVLAGIYCGFAAWTKNEGLLFLLAILTSQLLDVFMPRKGSDTTEAHSQPPITRGSVREASSSFVPFLAGIAPLLLLVAWFKHSVPASSELFSSIAFFKLLDSSRYLAILKWYGKDFLRFGDWFLIPGTVLLAGLYFALPSKPMPPSSSGSRACGIAMAMTFAGFFVIYLITPYDLYWHLRFSLNRLFLQLWPAAIFLFFLRTPIRDLLPSDAKTVSK